MMPWLEDDKFKEECGVFGAFNVPNAAEITYLGLYSLQHRGQESAGIVSQDKDRFYVVKEMGLVSEVFNPENLDYLKGKNAIGHVRYSTTGGSVFANIQPLYSKTSKGKIALAHNGNLTNAYKIYDQLKKEGALFQSTSDSEVVLHLVARSKKTNLVDAILESLPKIEGAYSMVILGGDFLVGARDPYGFRPLVLGRLKDAYILASETCALDLIGAKYEREIAPGEVVCITKSGIQSFHLPPANRHAFCIFEHVYFSRPDSVIFGDSVHEVRKALGRQLAKEHPVDADIVIAIPDSGNSAALGYAQESGIPFEIGITRNHYIGRTFIQPTQQGRDFNVKLKLNPISAVLKGKRVIVVDDSLVRGTTSKRRVSALREAGAKEVHLRISSPPVVGPCFFGIDTPKREKLIAATTSIEDIRKFVKADTLGYLSLNGMLKSVQEYAPEQFCTGCFTLKYPIRVRQQGKAMEKRTIKLYAKKNGH